METSRLSRVHVEVAENLVEITWDERDRLLDKLGDVAGSETIIERFGAVGASRAVVLDDEQRSRLRVTLDLWGVSVLPDGLARLLIALLRYGLFTGGLGLHYGGERLGVTVVPASDGNVSLQLELPIEFTEPTGVWGA